MSVNLKTVKFIAEAEGLRLNAYLCPAKKWTIGYGQTEGVKEGDVWTEEQATDDLVDEIEWRQRAVLNSCKLRPNENQLAALVSLIYNIGVHNFRTSTLLKLHNAGKFKEAGDAFRSWVFITVNGRKIKVDGLENRRERERALYLSEEK